ncbi:MAG TPA: universal stress protein [Mycobacteriales bacterium]|nr:universal stress protein [Mycobacteriales bacterium]
MTYENAVVVAIDEKDPDLEMLHWAAAQAAAGGNRLVLVHICEWMEGQRRPRPITGDGHPAERVVGAALEAVRAEFPDLAVTGEVGTGRPTPALLELSEQADLVVVGARGVGGFPGLLMGSVSGQLAEHGLCPVAVVRPVSGSATDVVVGIDGSPGSARALALALEQARRTGGTLVALHAYRLPPVAPAYAPNPGVDLVSHRELAESTLAVALGTVEKDNPDVKIERRVQHGSAARVLLDAAYGAAVLVVGARGLGGFSGLVAGSVSQQVLRHAHGPVIVAH